MSPLRIRTVLMFTLIGLAGLSVTGCNTFRGVGKDVEKVGEEVQEAADDVQNGGDGTPAQRNKNAAVTQN